MSHVLLLDTNVWSHLILGEENKRQKVQADLDALLLKYPGAARATSRICVADALWRPGVCLTRQNGQRRRRHSPQSLITRS